MSDLLWQKAGVQSDQRVMRFLAGDDVLLDREFFLHDIEASKAHVEGLLRINLLTDEESQSLVRELDVLALRRTVGMVFQRPTVFDGTVGSNLAVTGVPAAGHDEVLRVVGLDPGRFRERLADTLSGGEAQRLCLARALLMKPQVLVADEPTASLDHDAALFLESLARRIADSGIPVLWVTHDQGQVQRIADRQVRLDGGTVVP